LACAVKRRRFIAIENVRLFDEIQHKNRQLSEASRHKSQFLANMSNELRNTTHQLTTLCSVSVVAFR
jgi:GAF domain-containing protein